ncbi:hypothetical protein FMM74_018840 [Lachnospiraceae bacterium MD308]|nr:hypothetical protein [Lachnospiraceae bacterium MD308]
MAYESYKISLPSSTSVQNRMLNQKQRQIRFLYDRAIDREKDTLLNGKPFTESPRIFDRKFIDTVHHKITVETILDKDWIECGDYLEYEGMVWLCMNSYSFHKLYCCATFMSCDWKIYWINENGELKSQYVIDQNSTQYNSGETGNSTMTLGSAQHMLKVQCNDDTILLDSPMRFAIDKNIKKPTCYKVTQNDNTAYNYGKGLCCVTVTETPLNTESDKLITLDDGTQVWICDYVEVTPIPPTPQPPNETTDLRCVISGNTNLKIGYRRTYTVTFTDKDGNSVDWQNVNYQWNVKSDFDVERTINDNEITVSVNDENIIGGSFFVQIHISEIMLSEIKVNVVE